MNKLLVNHLSCSWCTGRYFGQRLVKAFSNRAHAGLLAHSSYQACLLANISIRADPQIAAASCAGVTMHAGYTAHLSTFWLAA